jgi:hypothetical protein
MGEMRDGGNNPDKGIKQDLGVSEPKTTSSDDKGQMPDAPDGQVKTDVSDVFADGEKGGLPVFDVEPDTFFANMKQDRRRMRFKSGTTVQKYMKNTKYRRPFWVRNSKDGYTYKVK